VDTIGLCECLQKEASPEVARKVLDAAKIDLKALLFPDLPPEDAEQKVAPWKEKLAI